MKIDKSKFSNDAMRDAYDNPSNAQLATKACREYLENEAHYRAVNLSIERFVEQRFTDEGAFHVMPDSIRDAL